MDDGLADWGLGGISNMWGPKCRTKSSHLLPQLPSCSEPPEQHHSRQWPHRPSRYSLASEPLPPRCRGRYWVFVPQCCDPDSANLHSVHSWVSSSLLETSQGRPVLQLWLNLRAWLQSLQWRNTKRMDWLPSSPEPVVTVGIFALVLTGTACSAL